MVFVNDIWDSCSWAIIINLILIGEGLIGMFGSLRKYSLQGTTQGNGLTGGLPPVRFSM